MITDHEGIGINTIAVLNEDQSFFRRCGGRLKDRAHGRTTASGTQAVHSPFKHMRLWDIFLIINHS
jgi:hypothetical protein